MILGREESEALSSSLVERVNSEGPSKRRTGARDLITSRDWQQGLIGESVQIYGGSNQSGRLLIMDRADR